MIQVWKHNWGLTQVFVAICWCSDESQFPVSSVTKLHFHIFWCEKFRCETNKINMWESCCVGGNAPLLILTSESEQQDDASMSHWHEESIWIQSNEWIIWYCIRMLHTSRWRDVWLIIWRVGTSANGLILVSDVISGLIREFTSTSLWHVYSSLKDTAQKELAYNCRVDYWRLQSSPRSRRAVLVWIVYVLEQSNREGKT